MERRYPKKLILTTFALGLSYTLVAGAVINALADWSRLRHAGVLGIIAYFGVIGLLVLGLRVLGGTVNRQMARFDRLSETLDVVKRQGEAAGSRRNDG